MTITSPPVTPELLTPQEVARVLGVDTKTLSNWRYIHRGPDFMKDGGVIRYPRAALAAYITQRTVHTDAL
jgi:hypothetical protein